MDFYEGGGGARRGRPYVDPPLLGQADVQRLEPHLGHNWLSCGYVSCEVQALWASSGTKHKAKLAIFIEGWLGR